MKFDNQKQGELYIFIEALFWGFLPVMVVLSYYSISPLMSLAWSTLFSSVTFAIILSIKNKWRELVNKSAWQDILWATFILGVIYYVFYFSALRYTSPGNASLVALTEIFFAYLFFNIWKKNHYPLWHIFGSLLILVGATIVLLPNLTHFQVGDILILVASIIAPFGNFFAKRARQKVSSEAILFLRSVISAPCLFILAILLGKSFFHN